MTESQSYKLQALHFVPSQEIERLRFQVQLSWAKELEALERLGFCDGLRVLDLGCGPGFVAAEIKHAYPETALNCLDVHPGLVKQAQAYLSEFGYEDVEVRQGDAHATGLAARTFDVVLARFSFQHFPNPQAVMTEVFRILKPGGKLIVIDVDDGFGFMTDPPLLEFMPMTQEIARAQSRGGGDRNIGRQLYRLMRKSGFADLDLSAILVHSDESGIDAFRHQLDFQRYTPLMHAGRVTPSQIESARLALERFLARDDAMVMASYIVCAGARPGP